ncbi:hypothetical protein P4H32_31930 [Bacillus cereus]|nr:hypothetical protein [Bacillus cereus]
MILKMEEAAALTAQGMKGVIESAAIIADDVKSLIGTGDVIKKQAPIRLVPHQRQELADQYVLDCIAADGTPYLLCIGVGTGTALMNFVKQEMLYFKEKCEQRNIFIQPGKKVLSYSARGIALVGDEILNTK